MTNLCLYYRRGRCTCSKKCPSSYIMDGKRMCKESGDVGKAGVK